MNGIETNGADLDGAQVTEQGPRRRITPVGVLIAVILLMFVAFWTWALFFASKESVNKIGDRAWAERAEAICETAQLSRNELIDLTEVDLDDPAMLAGRADLVDRATDIVETMLDDVVAEPPTDAKGQAIVPAWEADYRTYIQNRRDYADDLRAGITDQFAEAAVDGIPISERIATFAGDNEMKSC
ncbi:MAG TPA: hypothetical protein VGK49_02195, partial [Ilumatobacteraceae bacterium]